MKQPTRALFVVIGRWKYDGKEYLPHGYEMGHVVHFPLNHPDTQRLLDQEAIRPFDPAVDDRGPAVTFRNVWTKTDEVWHPRTEGYWAIRYRERAQGKRRPQFAYGDVGNPHYNLESAKEEMARLKQRAPEIAQQCCIVKLPCIMTEWESHVLVEE